MTQDGEAASRGQASDLFGRGMLYVVIWSMQMIAAVVVSPVLAYTLPVAGFGSLSAAIALYQLLIVVTVLGLDQALEMQRVEDSDRTRARGLLAAGLAIDAVIVGCIALLAPFWAPALGFSSFTLVLITLGWTAPGAGVLLVLSLLQAEDRFARFATVSLISTVGSQVVGIGLLFAWERTPEVYALGGVVGQVTALTLGLAWTRPRLAGLWDRETLLRGLRLGLPLALTGLSSFLLTAGDRFIIQRMLGQEQVARYQVAFTVGNVVTLMLTFTNRAWLPRLKSIADDVARWRVIAASRDGVFSLVAWAVLGITVAAPSLLRVFAPSAYEQEHLVSVVALIGLAAFPVAAAAASSQMLVTIRWSVPIAWASATAVAVKIVATFALIIPLGLDGAALATFLALLAQAVVLRIAVSRRHAPVRPAWRVVVLIVVAVAGCVVSVAAPQDLAWNIGRFAFACCCLVPFFLGLRKLQAG
ncbi:MAG: oligosaccharide flippase family protein [Propionibacterium sp.]|uniref:Oligosaccharide flippase family protein n=2 Tax=Arachnia rubra TaxID=1547448 RepID=A0ABX7Y980_9ACTN|nr:oligosaccharide flippase family protein [Propionibacterium sp.]QUC09561.1 oligosaccharide flippase family protein [Arachnia rubra]